MKTLDLRAEYMRDPEGIDAAKPRLSWVEAAAAHEVTPTSGALRVQIGAAVWQEVSSAEQASWAGQMLRAFASEERAQPCQQSAQLPADRRAGQHGRTALGAGKMALSLMRSGAKFFMVFLGFLLSVWRELQSSLRLKFTGPPAPISQAKRYNNPMQFNSTLQSHLTRGIVLHVSVLALVLAHQVYSAEESPPGGAEKIFFDEFDSPDPSESAGWYFRGNNLETEQVVQSGDLVLARKDKDLPVSGGSAVWKSFDSVVIDAGQTLRLTIVFSGAEGEKWPYFLISLADSPNTIDAHGDVLNEPPPRYFYGLGLPFGFEPGAGQFIEAAARSIWDQSSYHAAIDLLNLQAETPLQPIFAEPKRGLAPDRYADKAVLVWELHNEDGVMVSRGHWTGPDGSTVPLLELRAGQVQHFDFNKIGIGFMFWDAEWDYGKAVADSVWIDSVKLEKF